MPVPVVPAVSEPTTPTTITTLNPLKVAAMVKPLSVGDPESFIAHLAEDIEWEVSNPNPGSHPLAGTHRGKAAVLAGAMLPIITAIDGPVALRLVSEPICSGNRAVIELQDINPETGGIPYGKNGTAYDNRYCWVVEFSADGKIKKVRDYIDSAMLRDLVA